MSNFVVALLGAVGASTWLFTKLQRRSGGNTQQSLVMCAMIGIIILAVLWTALHFITSK